MKGEIWPDSAIGGDAKDVRSTFMLKASGEA
jgi:hypothetical protein